VPAARGRRPEPDPERISTLADLLLR
jgi:hypothetical protein